MTWADIDSAMKQKRCERPKGGLTITEIAAKNGWTVNHARLVVQAAIEQGKAKPIDGWKQIGTGRLCREVFYVEIAGKAKK